MPKKLCPALVFVMILGTGGVAALATDLKVTDSRGTAVLLTGATIDYSGLVASILETTGIRVLQGDGLVTVKWDDIESLRVLRIDDAVRPPRIELEIVLRNGKRVPATLFRQGQMKLLGKTELGDYSIDLAKVRAITPVK